MASTSINRGGRTELAHGSTAHHCRTLRIRNQTSCSSESASHTVLGIRYSQVPSSSFHLC